MKATDGSKPMAIPAGATRSEDGDFHYTDPQGKKWIYRQTPFGVARLEEKSEAQTSALMADKAAGGTGAGAAGGRHLLNVAYGNALFATRVPGAPETAQAFARARESAVGEKDAPERLAAEYGLWSASFVRGELPST